MTDTFTQYGVTRTDGATFWPDGDNHLLIPQPGIPSFCTDATDLDGLRRAVATGTSIAMRIVQRTVTYGEPVAVPDPRPTEPGWYFDTDGEMWRVSDSGHLFSVERDAPISNIWGPFDRARPEAELVAEVIGKLTDLYDTSFGSTSREDRATVAAEYGVTL